MVGGAFLQKLGERQREVASATQVKDLSLYCKHPLALPSSKPNNVILLLERGQPANGLHIYLMSFLCRQDYLFSKFYFS